MAPSIPTGTPRESEKPHPPGNLLLVFLFMTCTLCALFILWRRANALRTVVSHQLKTWTRPEGRIRLSEDDGPPATEFLGDDFEDDNERLDGGVDDGDDDGNEPLAQRVRKSKPSSAVRVETDQAQA